ncbi:MAG: hypothetical protein V3V63_02015 [Candidatus Hydrothermarchaeaceae archaeon]
MKCPFIKDNCYGDECALYDEDKCTIVSMTNLLDNIRGEVQNVAMGARQPRHI